MAKRKPSGASRSTVVYPSIGVDLYLPGEAKGGCTAEKAKEFLGWEEEPEGKDWGPDFLFRDRNGKKVRLKNNLTNRPFRKTLADRYMLEILRGKWALNGETVILDRKAFVQDGQHRLVGLVFAAQEWAKNSVHWSQWVKWKNGVEVPLLVVTGISEKAEVVDTINLGLKRNLADVLFRRKEFAKKEKEYGERDQKRLANILSHATRLVWLRTGGKTVSDAKHFPNSEALDFLELHPRIVETAEFVYQEEGGQGAEGKRISSRVSLGTAAGMMYLMAAAKTDPEWEEAGKEISFSTWSKAERFWTLFASGEKLDKDNPILSARELVPKIEAGGAKGRDSILGTLAKAWNAYLDGESLPVGKARVKETLDKETGKRVLAEYPRIGGLDVEREKPDTSETDGWKPGDTAFFLGPKEEVLFGTILALNGEKVDIKEKETEDVYSVHVSGLMVERPEEAEEVSAEA